MQAMGKNKSMSGSSTTEGESSKPKRRRRSTTNQSMNNTTLANYSNLSADLETNEIVGRLRSIDEVERLSCIEALAKIFGDPESNLAEENPSLWNDFLQRFCDASRDVRQQMLQHCVDIFANRQDFRHDISEHIVQRSRDPEEEIRHEAISSVASIVSHDSALLSEQFLAILKDRTLDKKFSVRRQALVTLASFYRKARKGKIADETKRFDWIKNKILHVYYQCGIEDKLLCERLTYTSLVPYTLEIEERMEVLFNLYCTLDDSAVKAFNEILKQQHSIRMLVRTILALRAKENSQRDEQEIAVKIRNLGDRFQNAQKATEQLKELFDFLSTDEKAEDEEDDNAFEIIKYLVGDEFTTKEVSGAINKFFQRLAAGSKVAHLQAIGRSLVERIAPVIIDGDCIRILVHKAFAALQSEVTLEDVSEEQIMDRAFNLLLVVSFSFPAGFKSEDVTRCLLSFLRHGIALAADVALQVFSHCSRAQPNFFPDALMDTIVVDLSELAISGSSKQAKHAVISLAAVSQRLQVLGDVMEKMKGELNIQSDRVETALAIFTTVAIRAATDFPQQLHMAARSIVQNVIMADEFAPSAEDGAEQWRSLEELAPHARAMAAAIKFLPRWLIGQNTNDSDIGRKTIKLLSAIVESRGDVKETGKLNYSEMAALRLAAGQALLKILQEKVFVHLLTMKQFRVLTKLIVDDCRHVRERFGFKLQAALTTLKLPLEFMAIYCYVPTLQSTADDGEKVESYKQYIQARITDNVARRRDFIRKNPTVQCRPEEFLPEYYLSYVVYLLSFYDKFESYDDVDALQDIRECLWFAMEPVLSHAHPDAAGKTQFLHKMFVDIKQTRNAEKPEDEEQNKKLWAVCDLAIVLLTPRVPNLGVKDMAYQSVLSKKCFTSPMKTHSNTEVYLPKELLQSKGFDKSFNKSRH